MPSYLYVCSCGFEEHRAHSIKENPKYQCPTCQATLTRKPQVANVAFVGKGFYSTDKHA